jgi:hypothetical protein
VPAGHGQNAGQRSPKGRTKRLTFTVGYFDFPMKTNNLSDNKRQQTTTVDYKRLFNGLVLKGFAFLQGKTIKTHKYENAKEQDR